MNYLGNMLREARKELNPPKSIEGIHADSVEEILVNLFTIPDALFVKIGQFNDCVSAYERIIRMWRGKNIDYKRFVAWVEENNQELPESTKKVLRMSPCGLGKLAAMHYRKNYKQYFE